jgi:hypothetical protein
MRCKIYWHKINLLVIIGYWVFCFGMVSCKRFISEGEFVKNEVNGIIVKLQNDGRDEYTLYIKEAKKRDTSEYSLTMGRFMKENHIQVMDSISKAANDHRIYFFRKKEGLYKNVAEPYYY